jgi:hypothetical protein
MFPIIPNLGQSCQSVLNAIAVAPANGDTNRADISGVHSRYRERAELWCLDEASQVAV